MRIALRMTFCVVGLVFALSSSAFSADLSKEEAKKIISKELSLPLKICTPYQVRRSQREVLDMLQQNGWIGNYTQGAMKGQQIYPPSKKGKQILCDEAVNINYGNMIIGVNSFVQDIEQVEEVLTDSNLGIADVVYVLGYRDNTRSNKEVSALFDYISRHGHPIPVVANSSEKQKKAVRLKYYDQGWRVLK